MQGKRIIVSLLGLGLLLGACSQQAPQPSSAAEDLPWSYTAPAGSVTTLSLDPGPGDNTLTNEPLLFASSGWGPFELNKSNGEQAAGDGKPLTLNGVVSPKGLGVHSNSELRYSLLNTKGATCSTFKASIGVDDEVGSRGSVIFQVLVNGVKKYDSGVMTGASATKAVSVNLTGGKSLSLVVTDAGDGKSYDHADWINPSVACISSAKPAPGTVDAGFGRRDFGSENGVQRVARFTALQPDGRIIGFGARSDALLLFLARLDQDGNFDQTFAYDQGVYPIESNTPLGLATYPDGRILVILQGAVIQAGGLISGYFVQRFLVSGATDPSFGNGASFGQPGVQFLDEDSSTTSIGALVLQSDGRIVIGGTDCGTANSDDVNLPGKICVPFLRRLQVSGANDPSFGQNGKVVQASATVPEGLSALAVQTDGKILTGTNLSSGRLSRTYVTRYSQSGVRETTSPALFDTTYASASIGAVRVLPNGKILVASSEETFNTAQPAYLCTLRQLGANLQPDAAYRFTQGNFYASNRPDLAVQLDGKAVLGGCDAYYDDRNAAGEFRRNDLGPAIFRFSADGTQDKAFGKTIYQNSSLQIVGAPVPDSRSVLIQPPSVGSKIISGLNVLTRLWP